MKYFFAAMAVGAYLFLLSVFVAEDVRGGVAGGTPVRTERTGWRTITTYYAGGRQIVYDANEAVGFVIRQLSFLTLALGLCAGIILAIRKAIPTGAIFSVSLTAGFLGLLSAFVTGMPLAVVLKSLNLENFGLIIVPLAIAVFALAAFVGSKMSAEFK